MKQLFRPVYNIDECLKSIREVLESGWTGQGVKCNAFESEWCGYSGAINSVYLNSATAALHLALKVLCIPSGFKVLTTPLTFCSTNHAILYENLIPFFCDVTIEDGCLDATKVIEALRTDPTIKAVMWVHLGGIVTSGFYRLMAFLKETESDVKVIEDCAHAAGSKYLDGKVVGSRSDTISCFSFQSVKNLPTADSGMLCLSDDILASRARKLAWLGIDKSTFLRNGGNGYNWKYNVEEIGFKYNANDIMASIALVQLKHLDDDNIYRRILYYAYKKKLKFTMMNQNDTSSTHLCVVLLNNRDKVMKALQLAGYDTGVHYQPNYEFQLYKKWHNVKDCPNVEFLKSRMLSLPNHLQITDKDIKKIATIINKIGIPTT